MTLYGLDVSSFQPNINLNAVVAEGFSWIESKVSEGSYFQDSTWAANRSAAAQAGLAIIGYHYANASDTPASQVQNWQANGGPNVCMIDFEDNSGDINDYWALVDAFNAAGVTVALTYLPQWYWSKIGSPDLSKIPGLISSAYPGGTGYASQIYANAGGDSGEGWNSYGGGNPVIWQFTDQATVVGMTADADAFRGSISDLKELLGGGDMQLTDTITDAYGGTVTVADILKWISFHADLTLDSLGGVGSRIALPPEQKNPGHPALGGDDMVKALARIGQALHLPGYDPAKAE